MKQFDRRTPIRIAVVVIAVFTLLTVADAPAPGTAIPVGLCSLEQENTTIYVNEMDGVFCSEDGGLTWTNCPYKGEFSEEFELTDFPKTVSIPDSQTQYRITKFGRIQVSQDNGKTWKKLSSSFSTSEAFSLTISQSFSPNANNQRLGAQDILYDPHSGNVIITLQSQGAVVIQPDNNIVLASIGENQPVSLTNPEIIISVLVPYFLLTLVLTILYVETILMICQSYKYWIQLLLAASLWGLVAATFTELLSGYYIMIGVPVIFLAGILLISIGMHAKKQSAIYHLNNNKVVVRIWATAASGALTYFVCYLLWYLNFIAYLEWATIISLTIALGWFIYCIILSYKWRNQPKDAS
jgi:hypothetical protein